MPRLSTHRRGLHRAVASVTGETLATIRGRGFSILDLSADFDREPDDRLGQCVDWDGREPTGLAFLPRGLASGAA